MRWIAALVLLVAAAAGGRHLVLRQLERDMIRTHRQGPRTPRGVYEEVPLVLPDRTLRAFYLPADGPGLLI
ncbi:MAG: hypothetical protein ACXWLM_10995, partial [Myxococcales bacterium]